MNWWKWGAIVSEGHTVGKMLAVAYAESFHAGRASGWFWPSR